MQQLLDDRTDEWRDGYKIHAQMTRLRTARCVDMTKHLSSPIGVRHQIRGSAAEPPHDTLHQLKPHTINHTVSQLFNDHKNQPQPTHNNPCRPHIRRGAIKPRPRRRHPLMGPHFWRHKDRLALDTNIPGPHESSIVHDLAAAQINNPRTRPSVHRHIVHVQIQMRHVLRVQIRQGPYDALEDVNALPHPLVAAASIHIGNALELGGGRPVLLGELLQVLEHQLVHLAVCEGLQTAVGHVLRGHVLVVGVAGVLPADHVLVGQWGVEAAHLELPHDADLALHVVPLQQNLRAVHDLERHGHLQRRGLVDLEVDAGQHEAAATHGQLPLAPTQRDDPELRVPDEVHGRHVHGERPRVRRHGRVRHRLVRRLGAELGVLRRHEPHVHLRRRSKSYD